MRICDNVKMQFDCVVSICYFAHILLNHLKETNVIMKASDVHNIVRKVNLKALCGRTNVDTLIHQDHDGFASIDLGAASTVMLLFCPCAVYIRQYSKN